MNQTNERSNESTYERTNERTIGDRAKLNNSNFLVLVLLRAKLFCFVLLLNLRDFCVWQNMQHTNFFYYIYFLVFVVAGFFLFQPRELNYKCQCLQFYIKGFRH